MKLILRNRLTFLWLAVFASTSSVLWAIQARASVSPDLPRINYLTVIDYGGLAELSWQYIALEPEQHYEIWRDNQILNSVHRASTYLDTRLTAGSNHIYQVRIATSLGEYGELSEPVGLWDNALRYADPVFLDGTEMTLVDNTFYFSPVFLFQVQQADSYETLCEGVASCTVQPGTYNIINLTTGTRSENVDVYGDTQKLDGLSIEPGKISWTAEGWFQIQNAQTLESVCEGGTECVVPPGTYHVINHGTGRRLDFVTVPNSSSGAEIQSPATIEYENGISVTGNVIAMPENAWHQVQSATDFSTVCEGVSLCTVPVGSYSIISFSSDSVSRKTDNVIVSEITTQLASPASDPEGIPEFLIPDGYVYDTTFDFGYDYLFIRAISRDGAPIINVKRSDLDYEILSNGSGEIDLEFKIIAVPNRQYQVVLEAVNPTNPLLAAEITVYIQVNDLN